MRHLVDVAPEGGSPYPVYVGSAPAETLSALWHARWRQAVLIGDDTTASLFATPLAQALEARGVEVHALHFPPGERSKTRKTKELLEDAMLTAHVERDACIVGVGGGVVLDLAGFVAATYLRGIDHVFVATTLLAQIDASIGGKTGVDTPHGKNLIGAFHQPKAVLCDQDALVHLPLEERRNGLAEAVKHAAVWDRELFRGLERWNGDGALPHEALIGRSIAIKAEVVALDTRDAGARQVLNFGHTVGHALEAATDHALPHGQAVAIGMVVEARLAARAGWLDQDDARRLEALLRRLKLPTDPPVPFRAACAFLASDKKTTRGSVRCALPSAIGTVTPSGGSYTRDVSYEDLAAAWSTNDACSA